jgi:hypothetical protein
MSKTIVAQGEIDCKRFNFPGSGITSDCPNCGTIADQEYLSYPKAGKPTKLSFWCPECETEWKIPATLHVSLEMGDAEDVELPTE